MRDILPYDIMFVNQDPQCLRSQALVMIETPKDLGRTANLEKSIRTPTNSCHYLEYLGIVWNQGLDLKWFALVEAIPVLDCKVDFLLKPHLRGLGDGLDGIKANVWMMARKCQVHKSVLPSIYCQLLNQLTIRGQFLLQIQWWLSALHQNLLFSSDTAGVRNNRCL